MATRNKQMLEAEVRGSFDWQRLHQEHNRGGRVCAGEAAALLGYSGTVIHM